MLRDEGHNDNEIISIERRFQCKEVNLHVHLYSVSSADGRCIVLIQKFSILLLKCA